MEDHYKVKEDPFSISMKSLRNLWKALDFDGSSLKIVVESFRILGNPLLPKGGPLESYGTFFLFF